MASNLLGSGPYKIQSYDPATGLISKADPNMIVMIALVWIQVIFVTMVYGPIAAFLVEYFRAKVRYTSLSIPYHFGNGWFGGLLPLTYTGLVGATIPDEKRYVPWLGLFDLRNLNTTGDINGNIYLGLAYVITVAVMRLASHQPRNDRRVIRRGAAASAIRLKC